MDASILQGLALAYLSRILTLQTFIYVGDSKNSNKYSYLSMDAFLQ